MGSAPSYYVLRDGRRVQVPSQGDVLFDQFSDLFRHSFTSSECPSDCPACARFEELRQCLLKPFRVKIYPAPGEKNLTLPGILKRR
jgi:hypothetical protein